MFDSKKVVAKIIGDKHSRHMKEDDVDDRPDRCDKCGRIMRKDICQYCEGD